MSCLQCGMESLPGSKICLNCAEASIKNYQLSNSSIKLATIGQRASALTVESLIWMVIIGIVVYFVLSINLSPHLPMLEQLGNLILTPKKDLLIKIAIQLVVGINLLSIIYIGLMFQYFGTTIGKLCLGITIINQKSGKKLNLLNGILRDWVCKSGLNLLAMIATFYASASISSSLSILVTLISIVQYLTPFIDPDKKALHDYVAGTIVIEN